VSGITVNESPPPPRSAPVFFERERGVTEVQVTPGIAHVTVRFSPNTASEERLALLQALGAANISLFLIKLHPDAISFAVRPEPRNQTSAVEGCESVLRARGCDYALLRDLGLVAVVAGAMRDLSGVMARIYEAMVTAGVGVRQTGDAYNAVLCLVAGQETERAAEALRRAFALKEAQERAAPPPEGGSPPRPL
jgi:aspartokinase